MGQGGVLFLDLSRAGTGWCYGVSLAEHPETGVWILGGDQWSFGRTWACLDNELAKALKQYRPAKVGIEAPLPAKWQSTVESGRLGLGLTATAEQTCYRFNIEPVLVKCDNARTKVIGRARVSDEEKRAGMNVKSAVVEPWVRSMGWRIPDNNARDAAVGFAYMLGYSHRRQALRRAA